jgi:SAM-dependent methyltransferase
MAFKDSNFKVLKDTDRQWKRFGRLFPYFGVDSNPRYKKKSLGEDELKDFFASGKEEIDTVRKIIREHIKPDFSPASSLDFGCGVGRLLIPIAKISKKASGVDVSEDMLEEARRNCDRYSVKNATLFLSDDSLSRLNEKFDFINTCIVMQHIPEERGEKIFSRLLDLLNDGGVGVFDFCYHGAPRHTLKNQMLMKIRSSLYGEPLMLMHNYNLNGIFYQIQKRNITNVYLVLNDKSHGHYGAQIFLMK